MGVAAVADVAAVAGAAVGADAGVADADAEAQAVPVVVDQAVRAGVDRVEVATAAADVEDAMAAVVTAVSAETRSRAKAPTCSRTWSRSTAWPKS